MELQSIINTERQFYMVIGNEQAGPFSAKELQALEAVGTITTQTLCWEEGAPDWFPADRILPNLTGENSIPRLPTMTDIPDWYYTFDGKPEGPIHEINLKNLIHSAQIARNTPVWKKGLSDWVPADQTQLVSDFTVPPPILGSAINNTWVWILAFAPLIGIFLEAFIAGLVQESMSNFVGVTFILNLALSYADSTSLKRAGHDTSRYGGWAWLIPVYLYRRAETLKQPKAYLICWVLSFVLMLSI